MEQLGLKPVPIWDTSVIDSGSTHYTTVLAPHTGFLKSKVMSFSLRNYSWVRMKMYAR